VHSFGTFTTDLSRLAGWFAECGVKTVMMESTGVYWIPEAREGPNSGRSRRHGQRHPRHLGRRHMSFPVPDAPKPSTGKGRSASSEKSSSVMRLMPEARRPR